MANLKSTDKKTKAQAMGMHTEVLTGRTQQKFFNPDEAEKEKQTTLKISGSDKQLVGTIESKLKTLRKIEPYKGKGVREKGQYVLKKEGKKK